MKVRIRTAAHAHGDSQYELRVRVNDDRSCCIIDIVPPYFPTGHPPHRWRLFTTKAAAEDAAYRIREELRPL